MNKESLLSETKHIVRKIKANETSSPPLEGGDNNINSMPEAIDHKHWEVILGELVHLTGLFMVQAISANGGRTTEVLFDQLIRHLEILDKMPGHDGSILIRRTHCKIPTPPSDEDYFAVFGNLMVRVSTGTNGIDDSSQKHTAHLDGALQQAFKCFSDQDIHSLFIQIPGKSPQKIDQLRLALNIVARFKTAANDSSSIRFRSYGRALTFSVINDANGRPDVNLTMTAALNGLSPLNARELVKQANAFHILNTSETDEKGMPQRISSYNQIFSVRSLRSQIVKPPVEVNNIPGLEFSEPAANRSRCRKASLPEEKSEPANSSVSSKSQKPVTTLSVQHIEEKGVSPGKLKNLITKYINVDDEKNSVAMEALMADDYGQLEPITIGERIVSLTRLLYALDKHCQDPSVVEVIIDFYRHRLRRVQDAVLSNIIAQRQGLKIVHDGRAVIVGLVHPRLFDLFTLVSEHVAAGRRTAIIKKIAFNFDPSHMADLAAGFSLSGKDAHHILGILKDCFSTRGTFVRPTFEGRIDLMSEYGNAIFEMLWCFLKETPRRRDRLDFLNALQLLMARLRNPKRATQFLLADICQRPDDVDFTDRNAFSLANILLHTENKELYVDINRTPENVLTRGRRLNKEVRRYALWRLDADRLRMLAKLRAIHHTLQETLKTPPGERRSFEVSFLTALEREAIIFMAIVGGMTSRIYLRELLQQYGKVGSDIYQHDTMTIYLPEIMAQLQLVVRSLGRAGNAEDVRNLLDLEKRGKELYTLDNHPVHKLKVQQLIKCIPQTIKMIRK